MQSILVPHHPNYFHFIERWVSGLYDAWTCDQLKLYYSGPYRELLTAFSPFGVGDIRKAPKHAWMLEPGVLAAVQCGAAARILDYFQPPPEPPCITIIDRLNNRKWVNASEVAGALQECFSDYECNLVTLEWLSFPQQLELMRRTRLLVAVHGAGLANAMFMQKGAAVLEVFPDSFYKSTYADISFRAGLRYSEVEAAPSPERDFRLLPEAVDTYLSGRTMTRELYGLARNACKRVPSASKQLRHVLRDVAYAPVSPELLCQAALALHP
jgi:Glycosyltransferase 61